MNRYDTAGLPGPLRDPVQRRLERLVERGDAFDGPHAARIVATLVRVWACSDFVADACEREPGVLAWLASEGRPFDDATRDWFEAGVAAIGAHDDDAAWMDALRRYRRRHLARIAWRDIAGFTDTTTVLAELSMLADACIGAAQRRAEATLTARHGAPRGADGRPLEMAPC